MNHTTETNATADLTFLTEMDGERDTQAFTLPAAFSPVTGGFVLCYDEALDDTVTHVTVTAVGDRMEIARRGDCAVTFLLTPGTPRPCTYETPYGAIPMTVKNAKVENNLTADGGTLRADYTLDLGGGSSLHTMTMKIRKENQ